MPSATRPAALGITVCLALTACGTTAPAPDDASAPSPPATGSTSPTVTEDPIELLTTALATLDEQSFRVSGDLDSDLGWCHVDWSIDPMAGTATATFDAMVKMVDETGPLPDGTLSAYQVIIQGDDRWEHLGRFEEYDFPGGWFHNESGAEDAIVTSPSEALTALFLTDDSTIEYNVDTGLTMRDVTNPYGLIASHCQQPEEKAPPIDLRMTLDDEGRPVVLSGDPIELTFGDYGRDVDAAEPDGTITEGTIVHDSTDPTKWNLTPRLGPARNGRGHRWSTTPVARHRAGPRDRDVRQSPRTRQRRRDPSLTTTRRRVRGG